MAQTTSGDGDSIQIEPETLRARLVQGDKLTLVDVRQGWEHEICQIPGSKLIPLDVLPQNLSQLPTDEPLVIICHHGMRSLRAALWLRQNGFPRAMNLTGGVARWAEKVDASLAKY